MSFKDAIQKSFFEITSSDHFLVNSFQLTSHYPLPHDFSSLDAQATQLLLQRLINNGDLRSLSKKSCLLPRDKDFSARLKIISNSVCKAIYQF